MASEVLGKLNCVWLDGRKITESVVKDPVKALAEGFGMINPSADSWQMLLDGDRDQNRIFIDDLHLSPLNIATKRKFLSLLQGLASSIIATAADPEANRKVLAERLDESDPVDSAECEVVATTPSTDADDERFLEFLKSFHLIKLIGQLIRNSPIAFDADQKQKLIGSGFSLGLRLVTFMGVVCSPESLQAQALNELRARVLKKSDRTQIEAKLTGLIYNLTIFLAFTPLRHACHYLAHPELGLIYDEVLKPDSPRGERLSQKILSCGLNFELRTPNSDLLRGTYKELTPAGQDILHMWTWLFLSFNRVPVSRRQALLESVEMSKSIQLLLPKGN